MAGFTRFPELALVGIDVARAAGIEFHVLIACSTARRVGLVTFFAGDFYVQAGERIFSLRVIEILGSLPAIHVVAFRAFISKLTLVRIGVAWRAIRRLAEEGLGEVLHFDQLASAGEHVRRSVTFFAGQRSVFAFELVASELVIELLL